MKIKLSIIADAIDLQTEESQSFFKISSGEVVLFTDDEILAAESNEDISEQHEWYKEVVEKAKNFLENEHDYIPLPSKYDFHEYSIMEKFVLTLPNEEQKNE